MDKNELITVLNDWNFWRKDVETGVPRPHYLSRVGQFLKTNQVLTIIGPRRAGKSFLMRQAAHELMRQGVARENILIVNFEDPRLTDLNPRLLERIYETYLEFLAPKGPVFLFLDEVQEVEAWEKWVRSMHELKKAKLVISGSNAKLLSRELGTLLTGRHLDVTVFPLSFKEFLAFNNVLVDDRLSLLEQRVTLQGLLRHYVESGSFPEVSLSAHKQETLLHYFEDLVTKDLLRRFHIRKAQELKALVKFYLSNISTLTTFNAAAKFLKLSPVTVEKFSGYLEQVYLILFLKRFSFTVKEQEKSPRKVYAIDTGLSNAVGFRFSDNVGRLAENVVFLELKRRQIFRPARELYYWKDVHHREVDFVIKDGQEIAELIQVCWRVDDPVTKDRELRSLVKAMEELKVKRGVVVTDDYEAEETFKHTPIVFVPLWKWLLEVVKDQRSPQPFA